MSVHVPKSGTRGAFFPKLPGWLAKRLNRMQANRFRRKGGFATRGVPGVILETKGAKSGELRQALIGQFPDGPNSWLVVASMAGTARHPQWFYNLAANPEATIEFGDGKRVRVRAETPTGADLDAAWATVAKISPAYDAYRRKTDREIPIVRLRTVDATGAK